MGKRSTAVCELEEKACRNTEVGMQALSKLKLIAEKARRDKKLKFTSLVHHINEELLAECYKMLRKDAASGIDGVTAEAYGKDLDTNLKDLVGRLKSKCYRPQPVRREYIPKPGRKELRPLGIPSVEDKLVQMALKLILEAVFEPNFKDSSHGFRPGKGCHTAIIELNRTVMTKPISYVAEVDIAGYFDTISHYWLLRCLEQRIADPNLLWLIRKFLKAGIMEAGERRTSDLGTPQGGVVSPILANIYLHFVLDLWFEVEFKSEARGYLGLIRYADDFIVLCESEYDAKRFLVELEERFKKFGLEISREKTQILKFGRKAWEQANRTGDKVQTFNFLGFTHYCAKTRAGKFMIGHKTSKQGLSRKLKAVNEWLRQIRSTVALKDWWPILKAKLNGHYGYFGVNGNMRCLQKYYYGVIKMVYKWINRRGKKSMNFEKFTSYFEWNPLPTPRIKHQIWKAALSK